MKFVRPFILILFCWSIQACVTAPTSSVKDSHTRPQKVLVTIKAVPDDSANNWGWDPEKWKEDWRSAFEKHGYQIMYSDEARFSDKSYEQDHDIAIEFRLRYSPAWDLMWFVKTVSISVIDLETGEVYGTYSDSNYWAHPSVNTVTDKIEQNFLSKIWH